MLPTAKEFSKSPTHELDCFVSVLIGKLLFDFVGIERASGLCHPSNLLLSSYVDFLNKLQAFYPAFHPILTTIKVLNYVIGVTNVNYPD